MGSAKKKNDKRKQKRMARKEEFQEREALQRKGKK